MSEQDGINTAERELEAALKSLTPSGVRIDPIAAAFDAGQRSCRRQLRVWQSATAAMLLLGAGLWFVPGSQRPAVVPHDVSGSSVALKAPASPRQLVTDQSLLMLQAAVAEHGLDALPKVQLPATREILVREAFSTSR